MLSLTLHKNQIQEIEDRENYIISLISGDVVLQKEDVEITSEDMPVGW